MGLLEYRAMTSLHDIAHDEWLCTFTENSSWKFNQLAAVQLLSGQLVLYGKGRRYGPSITYKITPCRVTLLQPTRGPPCWASPLAFGLINCNRVDFFTCSSKSLGKNCIVLHKKTLNFLIILLPVTFQIGPL
jgi:hypothetical protein